MVLEQHGGVLAQGRAYLGDPLMETNRPLRQSNTLVAPADGHDTTGQVDPAVHGTNGNVLTSVPGFPTELDPLVVNASLELGGRYSYTVDINGGVVLGTSLWILKLSQDMTNLFL